MWTTLHSFLYKFYTVSMFYPILSSIASIVLFYCIYSLFVITRLNSLDNYYTVLSQWKEPSQQITWNEI